MVGGADSEAESEAGVKIVKEKNTITITIEECDAIGGDLDVATDAVYQGMKFMVEHREIWRSMTEIFADGMPKEFRLMEEQFKERWEIPG